MIKVIIFDADGVLIPEKRKFSLKLEKEYGIPLEKTLPFFDGPFQDCLIGGNDLRETVSPYLTGWGWNEGVDALLDLWFKSEGEADAELIGYIQELRSAEVLCFLATNNEKYRFQYMLDKIGFANSFDKTYASAHLGVKKPDQEFFSKIFKELEKIEKDEVLFVDDSSENIKAAEEFGFHTEFYTYFANFKKRFASFNG